MPASIFAGSKVKTLKDTLSLNGGADLISSIVNPTSVATDGVPGSLLLNTSTGVVYKKNDSGVTTNWSVFAITLATTSPSDIGSSASIGSSTEAAKADHVHRGVLSVAKNGSSSLYGAVTLSGGTNITLTQSGQDISIANNPVAGAYTINAGAPQLINNNTPTTVVYASVSFETTSMMNTGTGILTVPETGYYQVNANHYYNATTSTSTDVQVYIEKSTGGGGYVQLQGANITKPGTTAAPLVTQGSFLVSCIAGDLLRIRLLQVTSPAANITLLANAQFNYMTINKVG